MEQLLLAPPEAAEQAVPFIVLLLDGSREGWTAALING